MSTPPINSLDATNLTPGPYLNPVMRAIRAKQGSGSTTPIPLTSQPSTPQVTRTLRAHSSPDLNRDQLPGKGDISKMHVNNTEPSSPNSSAPIQISTPLRTSKRVINRTYSSPELDRQALPSINENSRLPFNIIEPSSPTNVSGSLDFDQKKKILNESTFIKNLKPNAAAVMENFANVMREKSSESPIKKKSSVLIKKPTMKRGTKATSSLIKPFNQPATNISQTSNENPNSDTIQNQNINVIVSDNPFPITPQVNNYKPVEAFGFQTTNTILRLQNLQRNSSTNTEVSKQLSFSPAFSTQTVPSLNSNNQASLNREDLDDSIESGEETVINFSSPNQENNSSNYSLLNNDEHNTASEDTVGHDIFFLDHDTLTEEDLLRLRTIGLASNAKDFENITLEEAKAIDKWFHDRTYIIPPSCATNTTNNNTTIVRTPDFSPEPSPVSNLLNPEQNNQEVPPQNPPSPKNHTPSIPVNEETEVQKPLPPPSEKNKTSPNKVADEPIINNPSSNNASQPPVPGPIPPSQPPKKTKAPSYSGAEISFVKVIASGCLGYAIAKISGTNVKWTSACFAITTFATQVWSKVTNGHHAKDPEEAWTLEIIGQPAICMTSFVSMYLFGLIRARGALALSALMTSLFMGAYKNRGKVE